MVKIERNGHTPEVKRGKQWRRRLAQQPRQPTCTVTAQKRAAAERNIASALGPHTARQDQLAAAHLRLSKWSTVNITGALVFASHWAGQGY